MLKLLRIFTVAASFALPCIAGVVVYLTCEKIEQNFLNNAHNSNRTLSWSIANTATPLLPPLFAEIDNYAESPSLILDTPLVQKLDSVISRDVLGAAISEINVRNQQGRIIYSTSAYLLYKQRMDEGFQAAITGEEVTLHRAISKPNPTDGRRVHDLFTTYLPILTNSNGLPLGVISIQTDHSEHRAEVEQQKLVSSLLIITGLFLLYSLMMLCLWLVRRQHLQDSSKQSGLQEKLDHYTLHDQLTGLPNRTQFVDRIEYLGGICARVPHESFAVLLMDLDSFKVINESLGHQSGNNLLKEVGLRIRASVRPEDFVARLGGDEFGVIIENAKEVTEVIKVVKRIHQQFNQPFSIKGHEVIETISIGITVCQGKHLSTEDIVRDADIAMYRAKNTGRGRYELFNKHMHIEAVKRIEIEGDIRRGIESKEFFNRYQPIVDLTTGITHSMEALVRWAHPTLHEISPDKFVPVAEEIGVIQQIDQMVLKAAVDELAQWREALTSLSNLSVNVNHSARNFNSRPGMDNIINNLNSSGINGRHLKIELTESSILKNELMAFSMFEELRSKGVHLCMDDFGTGFSSLSYLRKLNFDMLKIDMSFVQDMVHSEEARKIVHTIIDMGSHLGISVTAEGVETEEQVELLKSMGCQYAQGFYYAKPLRADEVIPFIRAQIAASEMAPPPA